jgi:SAM-dependent methyltransferase
MQPRRGWFLAGLFLTTLAALALEILDTRLLSVLTWYHLSFFAVSVAMFGMSAGAVHVYLAGARFTGDSAARSLGRFGVWFALSIPLSHIVNLCIPLNLAKSLTAVSAFAISTLALSVPFYLAGVIVAVALTRIPGKIGLAYAVDLIGAAMGCLLVLPLLQATDISSAVLAIAFAAAAGAGCFFQFAGAGRRTLAFVLAVAFVLAAAANASIDKGFRVLSAKGKTLERGDIVFESWSIHAQVLVNKPKTDIPFYWGAVPEKNPPILPMIVMVIDGEAATCMTRWDGDPGSLDWSRRDLTSLPYHIRKGGDVCVIGVGGGRDILTALWARSASVTGIEINKTFIDLLKGPLREYANLDTRKDVTLVHDEARSYLTRTDERFDVVQMSLIDTFAASGAGAMTLSENGLYTIEAWGVFLDALKPGGILSVSRWHYPDDASETSRMVALGAAALLERGVANPADCLALVNYYGLSTLLVSNSPLSQEDIQGIERFADEFGFTLVAASGWEKTEPLIGGIARSRSLEELHEVIRDEPFDYSPPTDERPYFFNMIKPSSFFSEGFKARATLHATGNLLATATLALLGLIALGLVAGIIVWPLWRSGLPKMSGPGFASAVAYFACIGLGFMMVQIPYMQRFSIYLGHPTYAVAVILFSMILFAGLGSLLSDRANVESRPAWLLLYSLGIGATILALTFAHQPVIDSTIRFGLGARCVIVFALIAPLSLLMGVCFPTGMRLVNRISSDAMPWMWGVNGACGVLASVAAVWCSMWIGIEFSLYVAAALYAALFVPGWVLWKLGDKAVDSE